MSYKTMYIWVEGDDDQRFFEEIIQSKLNQKYQYVKIIQYAKMTKQKVNSYLESITSMQDTDYIFTADIDTCPDIQTKKQRIQHTFENVHENKIVIIVKMIEGWYLAGLDENSYKKLGISAKKKFTTTDDMTKQQLDALIPKKFDSRIDFMQQILHYFSWEIAKRKNTSLSHFIERYDL